MRSYQQKPYIAMQQGCKRFVEVIHRRGGKDRNWMNILLIKMLEDRGVYFHVFPALNQGRRDVWDNTIQELQLDGSVKAFNMLDVFPPELIKPNGKNETEMSIEFINGSRYQIMGCDDDKAVERLRGPNPRGLVFSEYAFMRHDPWKVLSPVLAENGGWAAFISTPNEEDDNFHKLYKFALTEPRWFCQLLTIEDTKRDAEGESGAPVITQEIINDERNSGKREEDIQREYYCSFKGYQHGTIYGDLIMRAREEKRISRFPHVPGLPVGICMDLGHSDLTTAWFYQTLSPQQVVFIGYKEETLKDSAWWAHYMREETRYLFGRMLLPWDGHIAETYYSSVGFRNIYVCKRPESVQSEIDLVRQNFSRFYFDEEACAVGIDHLAHYKRKFDEIQKVFLKEPIHDIHSHAADGLRTGVAGGFGPLEHYSGQNQPVKVETEFDPRQVQR